MKLNINHLEKVEQLPSKVSMRDSDDKKGYDSRRYYRNPMYYQIAQAIMRGSIGRTHSEILQKIKAIWPSDVSETPHHYVESWVDGRLGDDNIIRGIGWRCRILDLTEAKWNIHYFDRDNILRFKRGTRRYRYKYHNNEKTRIPGREYDRSWYEKRAARRKERREAKLEKQFEFELYVYLVNKPYHMKAYAKLKNERASLLKRYHDYEKQMKDKTNSESWRRIYKGWGHDAKDKWEVVSNILFDIRLGDHSYLDTQASIAQATAEEQEANRLAALYVKQQMLRQAA